jgi:DNA-binding MarR family transcriptional regulator
MEAEGMVRRESDPNDLRVTRAYLTDKGRQIDSKNIENIKKIDLVSTSKLTSEEIGSVMSILAKIRDSLMEEPEKQ